MSAFTDLAGAHPSGPSGLADVPGRTEKRIATRMDPIADGDGFGVAILVYIEGAFRGRTLGNNRHIDSHLCHNFPPVDLNITGEAAG